MASILTLGNFDGVHLGHRDILRRARAWRDERGHDAAVVAITFEPSPVAILAPQRVPPRLLSLNQRITRLREAGADEVVTLEPTAALLSQSAADFIADLVSQYQPIAMVEGEDFRFGHQRLGDMAMMRTLGQQHGYDVLVVPPFEVELLNGTAAPVRSTLIRHLIGHGRLLDAATCLGQPYSLAGQIIQGDQRGRTLGIPTANLDPQDYAPFILPPDGVYAGLAFLPGRDPVPAAISLGPKPTFQGTRLTLEAHLLDTAEDLYGQSLTLTFVRHLRDQYPFPNVDALKSQLHRDVERTRDLAQKGLLHFDPDPCPINANA